MSDDTNHDVTLDSTAFSLHFRNIALADDCTADSMRSMRTPTGDATTADAASIIVPTGSKNPFLGSKLFAGNLSGSVGGSSNMSLIEEKSSKYDYGKLSSTLVNLLDQVNRSIQTRSPKSANKVIASDSHLSEVSGAKESGENETRIRKAAGLNATGDCPLDSHLLEGSAKDTTTEQIVNSNAPEENIHLDHSISKTAEVTCGCVYIFLQCIILQLEPNQSLSLYLAKECQVISDFEVVVYIFLSYNIIIYLGFVLICSFIIKA